MPYSFVENPLRWYICKKNCGDNPCGSQSAPMAYPTAAPVGLDVLEFLKLMQQQQPNSNSLSISINLDGTFNFIRTDSHNQTTEVQLAPGFEYRQPGELVDDLEPLIEEDGFSEPLLLPEPNEDAWPIMTEDEEGAEHFIDLTDYEPADVSYDSDDSGGSDWESYDE